MCIAYSLRPRLSSRLTQGGRPLPWKPYPYGGMDFDHSYRYLCLDTHFRPLHGRLPLPLRRWPERSPTAALLQPTTSARRLVPIILDANSLDRSAVTHCLNGGCL